jgi:diaminopimelate epimerase
MKLRFTKMQGAGNDFIVLDGIAQELALSDVQWRALADRRLGIGADQMLVVAPASNAGNDFAYRIFNADGDEVEHCGNGARAFLRYVIDKGLTSKRSVRVEIQRGTITLTMRDDGNVTVDMGAPVLEPAQVPFDARSLAARREGNAELWPLELGSGSAARQIWVTVVSMGNPHAVQVLADVDAANLAQDGPLIEHHARFPRRVNAGFMQVLDRNSVRLRVWERGAGETLACGTGACAAVVSGINRGLLDSPVRVHARGGMLDIEWAGPGQPVLMTGPAVAVFEGEIEI